MVGGRKGVLALALAATAFLGHGAEPFRVLAVGEAWPSAVKEMLPQIGASAGVRLEIGELSVTEAPPEQLPPGRWDVLALRCPLSDNAQGRAALDALCLKLSKLQPMAEIVLEEPFAGDSRLAAVEYAMKKSLRRAPVGTAVRLYGAAIRPDPAAADAAYLQALVWLAKVTGREVASFTFSPSSLDAVVAGRVRRAAADAVAGVTDDAAAIPADVADGMARLRAAGHETCTVMEVDFLPPADVRVKLELRPSTVSRIRCEMRLPSPACWDGRLWAYGCGGWPDMRTDYLLEPSPSVQMKNDTGTFRYPLGSKPIDIEVRRDFGWRATHLSTLETKRLMRLYYGRDAVHSYFFGSSTGGRQAVMEAMRFPEDYDGILAGVPALDCVSHAVPGWRIAELKRRYGTWFTEAQAATIRQAERDHFAETDPCVAHGKFIADPRPTPEKLDACWRRALAADPGLAPLEGLWRALFEPVWANGRRLGPGFLIGTEFYGAPVDFHLDTIFGSKKLADASAAELLRVADDPEYNAKDAARLAAFAARGGRLITFGGLEDESVPAPPITEHYERALRDLGPVTTRRFFAHYLIPGRRHSPGVWSAHGAVGDPAAIREKIVAWVEKGTHPGELTVPFLEEPGRSFRIAPYPHVGPIPEPPPQVPFTVTRQRLFSGFDGKLCKVQPGVATDGRGTALMTFQKLLLSGSDVFFGQWMAKSTDGGRTWSAPREMTALKDTWEDGLRLCHYGNAYYSFTNGCWFGLGSYTAYRDDKHPIVAGIANRPYGAPLYLPVDAAKGEFTGYRPLEFPFAYDHAMPFGQFVECAGGDLLVPFYFSRRGTRLKRESISQPSEVVVVRYRFDGDGLKLVAAGTPIAFPEGSRGVCEPSLVAFGGRYYLTLRSDERGMFAVSDDGLRFGRPETWRWEDGTPIGNRNTQQHWLRSSQGLWLVYTRETAANAHVFRNRAPIYAARFDVANRCLVRESEFPLVPELGARLGNFVCSPAGADEMWLTTAEWMQPKGCARYGCDNSIWLVRTMFGAKGGE